MTRILVVEDEPSVAEGLRAYLVREGFEVVVAGDAAAARDAMGACQPQLVLLDWRLPDEPGIDLLRDWRAAGVALPVILLTARDELIDRVLGLELGADDYLTKPFEPRELLARIRARLRTWTPATVLAGGLSIDGARRSVRWHGSAVSLTRKEFDLLHFLAERPGRVFTRDELLEHVWDYARYTTRTVDTHVLQLRQKLSADLIETVRGVGYRLAEP